MNKPTHSPLPFDLEKLCEVFYDLHYRKENLICKSDRDFILRAVNSHYQMLEALKTVENEIDIYCIAEKIKKVKEAIALAENPLPMPPKEGV